MKVVRSTLAQGDGTPGSVLDDRLTVACAGGAVRLMLVQRAGKQPMSADDFLRGNPIAPGNLIA